MSRMVKTRSREIGHVDADMEPGATFCNSSYNRLDNSVHTLLINVSHGEDMNSGVDQRSLTVAARFGNRPLGDSRGLWYGKPVPKPTRESSATW